MNRRRLFGTFFGAALARWLRPLAGESRPPAGDPLVAWYDVRGSLLPTSTSSPEPTPFGVENLGESSFVVLWDDSDADAGGKG